MAIDGRKMLGEKILDRLPAKGKRDVLLLIFMLFGFIFLVLTLIFTYHLSTEQQQFPPLLGPLVNYHVEFIVTVAALGLAVGAGSFYLLTGLLEKKKAEVRWNADLLLKFLKEDERQVVRLMLERKGTLYQSEVAALDGMGKVKAHRLVGRLLKQGVIAVRKVGKINLIQMPVELLNGFSSEGAEKSG